MTNTAVATPGAPSGLHGVQPTNLPARICRHPRGQGSTRSCRRGCVTYGSMCPEAYAS
jgi:hypothetical protein